MTKTKTIIAIIAATLLLVGCGTTKEALRKAPKMEPGKVELPKGFSGTVTVINQYNIAQDNSSIANGAQDQAKTSCADSGENRVGAPADNPSTGTECDKQDSQAIDGNNSVNTALDEKGAIKLFERGMVQ